MEFHREPWRKLYTRESFEHMGWPLFARGLRDLLLRVASDDGTLIAKTKRPMDDMVRLLRATEAEEMPVMQAVGLMLDDGFLVHKRGRLWIRNFELAQHRTSSADRVAKHRAKKHIPKPPDTLEPVTLPVTVTPLPPVTETKRNEEKRRETKRSSGSASTPDVVDVSCHGEMDPRVAPVAKAIAEHPELAAVVALPHRWVERHVLSRWQDDNPKRAAAIIAAVSDAAADTPAGEKPAETLKRLRAYLWHTIAKPLGDIVKPRSPVKAHIDPVERANRAQERLDGEQRDSDERDACRKLASGSAGALLANIGGSR